MQAHETLGVLLQSLTWEQPQQMKPKVQPLRYLHPLSGQQQMMPFGRVFPGGVWGASLPFSAGGGSGMSWPVVLSLMDLFSMNVSSF